MTPKSAIEAAEVRWVNDPVATSAGKANRALSATGWVLTVLVGLFLLIDGGARVAGETFSAVTDDGAVHLALSYRQGGMVIFAPRTVRASYAGTRRTR